MLETPILNIPVAFACNLACEGCSHYSNHAHRGFVPLDEAETWMKAWSGRLRPGVFSLLGGEPTVHPELVAYARIARACWPDSHLRLVTNGFFLHRHPELRELFAGDPRASIHLSIHHDGAAYREKLAPALALLADWERAGVTVEYRPSWAHWTRRYHGHGAGMRPFRDGDARRSWEVCIAKDCKQIFRGRLWKCGPLAYLPVQHGTHPLSSEWDPYLAYEPLDPGCSDAELAAFLAREEEAVCEMCPATRVPLRIPSPLPGGG